MIWGNLSELDEDIKVRPKPAPVQSGRSDWILAADVYEKDDNVIVKINLPGVDPDSVDISVSDDSVRISGTSEEEEGISGKDYFIKEIRRGSFERTVKLPARVNVDMAEADYKKGTLKITVPRKESAKINKIKVRSSD